MATLETVYDRTLYGPWRITLGTVELPCSFVVSGSDNADGRYKVEQGAPLDVLVTGTEWTISLWSDWPDANQNWRPLPVLREMTFEPQNGLVVSLGVHPGAPHRGEWAWLTCTSTDPETNPIPTSNPYDFTTNALPPPPPPPVH
jgi:hypothetical protein